MRKLTSNNSVEQNNLITIQSNCRCIAYCSPEPWVREYYLHLDDTTDTVKVPSPF